MAAGSSVLNLLVEFWASLIKLLSRPAVQLQLIAIVGAIVCAFLLAHWMVGALQRRQQAKWQRIRTDVVAQERGRHQEEGGGKPAGELPLTEDMLDLAVEKRLWAGRRLSLFAEHLIFPLLATVLLYGAYVFFVRQSWYSGLLADSIVLLAFYLLFRIGLGFAYALGQPQRVRHYDQRLFTPLFSLIVGILIIHTVVDINLVANTTLFRLENGLLTLGSAFIATIGFYFWIVTLSLLKELIEAAINRRGRVNPGSLDAALTLVQYGLIALGLLGVFQTLQFNSATIAAITGGLSIGIGFALQDVLKNFLGGIIVLFEGSVRPGDWIQIAGTEGEVDKLSIRSTIVRTGDNVEYIVPNQDWLSATVTTFTRNSRRARARVPIGVSYDSDPHFVRQLLTDTARAHPDVLADPPPVAALVGFSASSVDFVVLAWVDDIKIKGRVAGELRMSIWDALKANHIEIPYPQQDVHIRSGLPELQNSVQGASGGQEGAATK